MSSFTAPEPPKTDLIAELPVAVVVTDPAGTILELNGAAIELLARAREDCLGKDLAGFIHPRPQDVDHPPATAAAGPRETPASQARLRCPDGSHRAIESRRRALADGRVVNVLLDVTTTAIDADALRVSEQQLKFVANTVPALLAFVGTDARYVWVNESYRRWFGLPLDAIRGHHAREVLGEASWEQVRTHVERVLAGEEVVFEYRAAFLHGPARDVHVAYLPHRDAGGGIDGFVVQATDVTGIRVAEREVRRAREELQLVVDSTPALIAHYDSRRRLVWANNSYTARFGKAPGELVGRSLSEIVGDEGYPIVLPFCDRVLAGETIDTETEVTYPTLGRRFVHMMAAPTRDANGAPDGCVAVITDVTPRHDLERALRLSEERALDELKEADRQKDEFLAMLSHELRNPLAPILSAVEILRLADPSNPALSAEYRALIERQVNLMKRLLDDLLDVARVSQGKIALRQEVIDLGGVVKNAVEVSRPLMAEKEQRLSVTSVPGAILVNADATRLVQVFANLLNNAAKYSARGGRIRLELAVAGDEAIVSVRDEGIGMPPELLDRVFDLFVQETRSLDRAQGGLGIGLTMVRSLVRMHGGSVRAFSDGPGLGSEVVVRLPRAPARPPASESAPAAPAFSKASHPLRILVVDDNLDAARALGTLLGLLGHEVTLAPDGPAALELIPTANPELVLIDIGLPKMDGYALAAAIREAGIDRVALVAVTGYGREEDLRRSREAGFDHHLVKPIDLATLHQITNRQLDRG